MEIKFLGHSSFLLSTKGAKVLIDPFKPEYTYKGYSYPKIEPDLITISHNHEDHNYTDPFIGGSTVVLNTSGEYEIKEVLITGYDTYHDEESGSKRGINTVFEFQIEEMRLLHMGDFGEKVTSALEERLPSEIDVLFIPVGGTYTIDAEAAKKVCDLLSPKIVIPMHFKENDLLFELDPVEKFMSLFDQSEIEEKGNTFKITSKDLSSSESTKVYIVK